MRLASYNVENLFTRAKALNLDTWGEGRKVLEQFSEINAILALSAYGAGEKTRIIELMKLLGIDKKDDGGQYVTLRQNRGKLVSRGKLYGIEVTAHGRADWSGWVEMKSELVNETATRNSAQVVRDVAPDVLAVIECEGREALLQFSGKLLPAVKGASFAECMATIPVASTSAS
jgi:hypothetical protein